MRERPLYKVILAALIVFSPLSSFSQKLEVVDFYEDVGRLDAVKEPVRDLNGTPCGLIRLGLVHSSVEFEGDIMKKEYRNCEWYIWMAQDARFIVIKADGYPRLSYDFDEPIRSMTTYIMTVEIPQDTIYIHKNRLINDWTKDFKIIVGINNGIVSSELLGFYGEIKFGERSGFGFIGGGIPAGYNERYGDRWSLGVMGYLKNFTLTVLYGTLLNVYERYLSFEIHDDGTFYNANSSVYGKYGCSALFGYDRSIGWLHLSTGIGLSVPQSSPTKVLFVWNVGIGLSFVDLFSNF